MASSNANLFVIAEHDIKDARQIVLRGRTLPYQGISWTSKQRVDINYFPGNPVAVAQVIGATWGDTKAEGRWSDLHLLSDENAPDLINFPQLVDTAVPHPIPSAVERRTDTDVADTTTSSTFQTKGAPPGQKARTAEQVRDAMWQLSRGGQLLRVEWGPLVRYGYLVELTATHDRREDIEWEALFHWIGDKPTQPKPSPKQANVYQFVATPVAEAYELLRFINGDREPVVDTNSLAWLQRTIPLPDFGLGSSHNVIAIFLETYRRAFIQFVRKINSSITDMLNTLDRIIKAVTPIDPRELFGNVKSSLAAIRRSVDEMYEAFDAVGAAIKTAFNTNGNPSDMTMQDGLERGFRKLALKLAAECRTQEDNIDKFITPKVRAILRPSVGISLRDISVQEYGTANNWRAIQDFNGFPDSVVPAGAIVRVPDIPFSETNRRRTAHAYAPSSLSVAGVV